MTRARTVTGFSLVEMLFVVVIIGVLAAIALPGYRDYVLRTHRSVARSALLEVAARQEAWFTDRKLYATDLRDIGYPANPFYLAADGSPRAAPQGVVYRIELAAFTGSSYTATATVQNDQARDGHCWSLSLTNTGARTATPAGNQDVCWSR